MKRKEILEELYKKIGGADPGWISDFQKIYKYPIGNKALVLPTQAIYQNMASWNYLFSDVSAIISYEHCLQLACDELIDIITHPTNSTDIKELKNQLKDVIEAIEKCYITLGKNYHFYEDKAKPFLE